MELAQSQAPQHNAHRLDAAVQNSIQLVTVALFQLHTKDDDRSACLIVPQNISVWNCSN